MTVKDNRFTVLGFRCSALSRRAVKQALKICVPLKSHNRNRIFRDFAGLL